MSAWMLLIGLSAADPKPAIAAAHFAKESECRSIASAIERQSTAAGAKLYPECGKIEPITITPDGRIEPKAPSAPESPIENSPG